MIDSDLYFRETSDGNLTADEAETTHIIDLGPGGTPANGLDVWVRVPQDSGTDTLDVTVYSDDSSTLASPDEDFVFPQIVGGTDTFPLLVVMHVSTRRRYLGMKLDVTDTGGGVNFGAVEAGIGTGMRNVRGLRP